ncbi:alpha-L-fucosidase-like isoform X2 [Haliotis rufescens]|uniref:alpha-L-fucosidase-like isoform X2 n=1 Tax=Haliotis rufescens TaxID=6454 RepID=UPI00201E7E18|nr:alpha-L-fucosidase-like isoform X2 [Haliotis rufescens]
MAVFGVVAIFLLVISGSWGRYDPTWASLDTRPLPVWYDEAKLGIFIHWGVFSVPSYNNEWFWYQWKGSKVKNVVQYMEDNFRPDFTYADFARGFTTEFFDPAEWADIIQASGAKYVVLTSKHHEGFTNWPSKYSFNWNSMDNGPNRDLVGELGMAIRNNTAVRFGLYHSLFEWFHPLFLKDKASRFKTNDFVASKTMPELLEIVQRYKPEVVWSDGDWEAPDSYWNSTHFLAWLYNDSPVKDTVVTNDRWGAGIKCKHGDFYTCRDRYNPGKLQPHKFENAMTIDSRSWGFRREAKLSDYLSIQRLIQTFVETVSCGGNMLMNVGPTKYGKIAPIFEERLRQMGQWLRLNGDAIYSTRPWTHQNDTVNKFIWYTSSKSATGMDVYAIYTRDITIGNITLGAPNPSPQTQVMLLGNNKGLSWSRGATGGMVIHIADIPFYEVKSQWAYAFRLTHLQN